jgi:hypothetical protein
VIDNKSDVDLFVTVLDLGTGGGIGILSPGKVGQLVSKGTSVVVPEPFYLRFGPPRGLETYQIIATTTPSDFRFIEQPGIKALSSPIDLLFDEASSGRAKDTSIVGGPGLSSWTTTRVEFDIR